MHINFEDENIVITNLQIFLKENQDRHLHISGVYDTYTHEALINYLKQPNTEDMRKVKSKIIKKFTYRDIDPPHSLVDGGGIFNFDNKVTNSTIYFYTKPVSTYFDNGVQFINNHIKELDEFVRTMGWAVSYYTRYAYNETNSGLSKAEIRIDRIGIDNFLPNSEVLPMVNAFTGKYLYNKCFVSSGNTFNGFMQNSKNFKVAYIPCTAGDTFTIAHGYSVACEIAVGYSAHTLSEIRNEGYIVEGITNRMNGSTQGAVQAGDWIYYEVPEDSEARYLLIQMPFTDTLQSASTETVNVILGDVNQDGIVDEMDVQLLNQYVTALENNSPLPFQLSESALVAANVNRDLDLDGNPIIDRRDVVALQNHVENNIDLPIVSYERTVRVSPYELDRLLIMYGQDARDESKNIPIEQFYMQPWAVHEKFLQYFFGRVIHKYSPIQDIEWLQTNIRKYNALYSDKYTGYYDSAVDYETGDYVKYDKLSGRWKYYRDDLYLGYYLDTISNIQNCYIRNDDSSMSNMEVKNGRIYVNKLFDGRYILTDGTVVTKDSEYCLKALVKRFQLECNDRISYSQPTDSSKLTWTIGYYDVDTDEKFVKFMGDDITYNYGAFR